VTKLLDEYRKKARSPTGNFSPTLAPIDSRQDVDAARARVEAGIFMLNEIFPNDIIVHDCMNPKAKNHKGATKAVISRASLIHLQARDHRRCVCARASVLAIVSMSRSHDHFVCLCG
jgi:hypothetical protein